MGTETGSSVSVTEKLRKMDTEARKEAERREAAQQAELASLRANYLKLQERNASLLEQLKEKEGKEKGGKGKGNTGGNEAEGEETEKEMKENRRKRGGRRKTERDAIYYYKSEVERLRRRYEGERPMGGREERNERSWRGKNGRGWNRGGAGRGRGGSMDKRGRGGYGSGRGRGGQEEKKGKLTIININ